MVLNTAPLDWESSVLTTRSLLHFVLTALFVLTLASDMAVLHRNDPYSILIPSSKKRYSSFLKKVFVFKKIYFKSIENIQDFHWLSHKDIPICQTGLFWIVPNLLALKWSLQARISSVKIKTNSNFAVKLAERSNHLFLLSIWWISFFKHLYLLKCDNGMYRI